MKKIAASQERAGAFMKCQYNNITVVGAVMFIAANSASEPLDGHRIGKKLIHKC
jgi:hypothetical protein